MHKAMGVSKQQKAVHSRSSQHYRAKATNRVDDLQGMVSELQQARREGRLKDVALLEEQMHQMLREWKAELREASPASSLLQIASPSSSELSSDMERLLQLNDEDDDATSKAAPMPSEMEQEPFTQHPETSSSHQEAVVLEAFARVEQSLQDNVPAGTSSGNQAAQQNNHSLVPSLAAYLHPKCALWDCPRSARGGNEGTFYCSSFHEDLAINEGAPGMSPVVRPGGIDLKDGPLFAALAARVDGHAVGIPELQGAATSKSPWNATDLFDVAVHPGETLREWLFFDKPRRAFESGTRKQRSLPDYGGRGWHESRKQVMKDLGGLKRSYYMDPQPEGLNEWHMYEYELTSCTDCALYRLELKQVDASKKSGKAKATSTSLLQQTTTDTSVASLQHQIGRLSADLSGQNAKDRKSSKGSQKRATTSAAKNAPPLVVVAADPEQQQLQ